MKANKFLRQQSEKEQRKIKEEKRRELNRKTVLLRKDDSMYGNYRWSCPNHDGTFSWSRRINDQWGHPEHLAFCAVCCEYFNIEISI